MSVLKDKRKTITATEFAELLGVAPATFRKQRKAGQLPAPLIDGRYPLWSLERVEQWLVGETVSR